MFISDQMCVPDFDAGAMENWGLVIYREIYLLFDNATEYPVSSVTDQYEVAITIAHELAHQVAWQSCCMRELYFVSLFYLCFTYNVFFFFLFPSPSFHFFSIRQEFNYLFSCKLMIRKFKSHRFRSR